MTIAQIDTNVHELVKNFQKETFLYSFMRAFDFKNATIARLGKGTLNMSKEIGETVVKKKFWFKELTKTELAPTFQQIKQLDKIKHDPRFVILTDYTRILAYDTKTKDSLDTTIKELTKDYAFFLPLAGMEKTQYLDENPADVKAAEKMAKLFDEIKKVNATDTTEEVHHLNVFLSRLLFCFFAEDTQIFSNNQFTNAISSHTQEDGSDLSGYLTILYEVLNQAKRPAKLAQHLADFPYVNGGLFQEKHPVPVFSKKARKLVIECGGDLDWSAINPDIFGSMIQAVVTPEHRGGLGMHYTSVPNIMKVIEPLFLDDLYGDFQKSFNSPTKLKRLHLRLTKLKIFDPACGSGNFLIIAYKEIRKLEITIFRQYSALKGTLGSGQLDFGSDFTSLISLSQFYGIELDDFAHEVASLSLWLTEHQMNTQFFKEFGKTKPTLPLNEGGNIIHGNACRLDWEVVCPKKEGDEIYILGNPPYRGFSQQEKQQKEDLKYLLGGTTKLDYISIWFIKASLYISKSKIEAAFVSTNSICQGEQVALLWEKVLKDDIEIGFAHKSFKWTNNAKGKAAVICIIVGIRQKSSKPKFIYNDNHSKQAKEINGYLSDSKNVFVYRRRVALSNLPPMVLGNMPYDRGILHFSINEFDELKQQQPDAVRFLKKVMGSKEFINGYHRYCIWIKDNELDLALKIPEIKERIVNNQKERLLSKDSGVRKLAAKPHQFREMREANQNAIILPGTSSERRHYIPVGYVGNEVVINNLAFAIYDPESFILGIICSKMHMTWVRAIAGRLKSDYRYSSVICYNTFPFPKITDTQKEELETHVYKVLEQREQHSEKTLAQLYDPDKMPEGLRAAHHELDLAVERCYRKAPFTSDEERLAYLFKLYEQMIAEEAKEVAELAAQKKNRKQKKS